MAAPTNGELEQRLIVLERKMQSLSDLVLQFNALQREVQQLRGQVELQNHTMDTLNQRQHDVFADLEHRMAKLQQTAVAPAPVGEVGAASPATAPTATTGGMAAPNVPSAPVPPVAVAQPQVPAVDPTSPAQEKAVYDEAFKLLMQHQYGEATTAFKGFLNQYPNGHYSGNAQYWLAEASYAARDFDGALREFQQVIQQYPQSVKVPDAWLKSGYILYEMERWKDSEQALRSVIQQYPDSTAARLAGKRLDRMQREGH